MSDEPGQDEQPQRDPLRRDQEWDWDQRGESELQRLDRNWADLLQELRVVQTGVQLLTGFLLTLPFQSRFADLDDFPQDVYLATLGMAIAATGFLIAPVAIHRVLFRRHGRLALVGAAHRLAILGTAMLGSALVGVVLLLFDVLRGRTVGIVAASITMVGLLVLWLALPWALRIGAGGQHRVDHESG